MGTGGFFPGVERLGREADHSHLSNAEVRNERSYRPPQLPPYTFMAGTETSPLSVLLNISQLLIWSPDTWSAVLIPAVGY
jgi:hypothetical protein